MDKLKPCPFCGERETMMFGYDDVCGHYGYSVVCDPKNGGCGASGGRRATIDEAEKVWNKRTADKEGQE